MKTIQELYAFLGLSAWVLLLIPAVILVRLLIRRSRWSILRMTLVALTGVAVVSLWLTFYETVAGLAPGSLSGGLGTKAAAWLTARVGTAALAFVASTALLFLWTAFAFLDAIIATTRFCINKPYVREIRRIVEAERPVTRQRNEKKPAAKPDTAVRKGGDGAPTQKKAAAYDAAPAYRIPPASLLRDGASGHHDVTKEEIDRNIAVIRETLADHHVQVADIEAIPGPTVTLYKVFPAKGVKVAAIRSLTEDVSVALKAGKVMASLLEDCVGLEVANRQRSAVTMRELAESREFRESRASLPVAIGREVTGKVKVFDLADAPHLLVAGATGQGKSVGMNVIVASLLLSRRPSQVKMVFVDPKKTEFGMYSQLSSHYLAVMSDPDAEDGGRSHAIAKSPADADTVLQSLCQEMSDRYDLLEKAGTRDVKGYNERFSAHKLNPKEGHRFLPYIVVFIDEYAQLVLGTGSQEGKAHAKGIMTSIISLAQMGRACGIHLVIATQTPRRDVISGLIKANFPMSIAYKTKTNEDSRVILDRVGAEKLLGKGDMLLSKNASLERIQCGNIETQEIQSLLDAVASQKGTGKSFGTPYLLPEVKDEEGGEVSGVVDTHRLDPRLEEAARLVVGQQSALTSYLQTTMETGYARSARIMSQLEAIGIVGPQNGSKKREVLVSSMAGLEARLEQLKKQ